MVNMVYVLLQQLHAFYSFLNSEFLAFGYHCSNIQKKTSVQLVICLDELMQNIISKPHNQKCQISLLSSISRISVHLSTYLSTTDGCSRVSQFGESPVSIPEHVVDHLLKWDVMFKGSQKTYKVQQCACISFYKKKKSENKLDKNVYRNFIIKLIKLLKNKEEQ